MPRHRRPNAPPPHGSPLCQAKAMSRPRRQAPGSPACCIVPSPLPPWSWWRTLRHAPSHPGPPPSPTHRLWRPSTGPVSTPPTTACTPSDRAPGRAQIHTRPATRLPPQRTTSHHRRPPRHPWGGTRAALTRDIMRPSLATPRTTTATTTTCTPASRSGTPPAPL